MHNHCNKLHPNSTFLQKSMNQKHLHHLIYFTKFRTPTKCNTNLLQIHEKNYGNSKLPNFTKKCTPGQLPPGIQFFEEFGKFGVLDLHEFGTDSYQTLLVQ